MRPLGSRHPLSRVQAYGNDGSWGGCGRRANAGESIGPIRRLAFPGYDASVLIYVDGDACPVKEQVYRVAARYHVPVVVVANSVLRVPGDGDVSFVQVVGGLDVADDWIAERAEAGDIVATADIPLASRVLERGAVCIDFRGKEFSADAIGGMMASREIALLLRQGGGYSGGPPPISARDRGLFAGKLDEVVNRVLRAAREFEQ